MIAAVLLLALAAVFGAGLHAIWCDARARTGHCPRCHRRTWRH